MKKWEKREEDGENKKNRKKDSSKELGFLNPIFPFFSERGVLFGKGRDVSTTAPI